MPGDKSRTHLRPRPHIDVKTSATYLGNYMRTTSRRFGLLWFDRIWFFLGREMKSKAQRGSGYMYNQKEWFKYFSTTKLHGATVIQGDVEFKCTDGIWRSGPDRCDVRSTSQVIEASNNVVAQKLERIARTFYPANEARRRPTLVEVVPRLEKALQTSASLHPHSDSPETNGDPSAVDPAIVKGHPSIRKHSLRWHPANFFAPRSDGANIEDHTIYEELRGPYRYFVMSAERSKPSDLLPPLIPTKVGCHMVDFVTLPPAADRNEGWLLAHGYLVDGGRVSWANIIESLKFAVVRFDTRLADTCAACAHTWLRALTCVLRCDENLNHRCCEHVVAVRHILKDPDCDLNPSILTAPVGIGRPPPTNQR